VSSVPTSPLKNEVRGNLQLESKVPNPVAVNSMLPKIPLREIRKVLLKDSSSELCQVLDVLIKNAEHQNKAIAVVTQNLEYQKKAMNVLTQNIESQKKSMAQSDLVLAKVMKMLKVQEAEQSTPGTLSAGSQATNNPQLASDSLEAVTVSDLLFSSDSNYNEYRTSTSLTSNVRGDKKVLTEAAAAAAESRSFQAGPEQHTDELDLEQDMIPTLPVNTQATTTPQLVSKVLKAAVVNRMHSSFITRSQRTFQDTTAETGPSRSKYLSASSSSTRASETPKYESWKKRFHGHDNAGLNSLRTQLSSTPNSLSSSRSYSNIGCKFSFGYHNGKSSSTVATNISAARRLKALREYRYLQLISRNNPSAASVDPPATVATDDRGTRQLEAMKKHRSLLLKACNRFNFAKPPIHGILNPTSGALDQPSTLSIDNRAGSKSVVFDMSKNIFKGPPLKLRCLKALAKDKFAKKRVSAKTTFQPIRYALKHVIPRSPLLSAEMQQIIDSYEEDLYVNSAINNQDSRYPPLPPNASKTEIINRVLLSISNDGAQSKDMRLASPLRQVSKVSSEEAVAVSYEAMSKRYQEIKEREANQLISFTSHINNQSRKYPQLVSNGSKSTVVNSMRSYITTSDHGTSNNTIAQGGPSRSRYISSPSRSRYISASSRSTRKPEASKLESQGERFCGHDNAVFNLLRPQLPSIPNVPPSSHLYSNIGCKFSFAHPNGESPLVVVTIERGVRQ